MAYKLVNGVLVKIEGKRFGKWWVKEHRDLDESWSKGSREATRRMRKAK